MMRLKRVLSAARRQGLDFGRRHQTTIEALRPGAPQEGPPKRLILFIGHHKVGSTSLQDFFARNAVALAGDGVLYPFVDFQGLSYLVGGSLGRSAVTAACR